MKTLALLTVAALLAPAAFLASYHARRRRWPATLGAALLLAFLILGARCGLAW